MRAAVIFTFLLATVLSCARLPGPMVLPSAGVREPAFADQFYPADPVKLRAAIDGFLHDALPRPVTAPVAIVVPHAGYVFSGQIAADAYRVLKGACPDTVVILGANHTGRGYREMAVFAGAGFRTPLGTARIDTALASAIVQAGEGAVFDNAAHDGEHSVEVQVPFVQRSCPAATIVPIVVGEIGSEATTRFGRSLAHVLAGRRVVIVASSDLSHYPRQDTARDMDRRTLAAIASLDPARFTATIRRTMAAPPPNALTCACGEGAVRAAMEAARGLGATRGAVISYANSADTLAGQADRVVGYGAVVFEGGPVPTMNDAGLPGPPLAADPAGPLGVNDRRALLRLARETITRFLATDTLPLPRGGSPRLEQASGVFVTLKKHGELRGCIGQLEPQGPLERQTALMAYQAAFRDARFPPVREDELPGIDIEVSVLTPMQAIPRPASIVLGRDGVVLRVGDRSAVFLPDVAAEQRWTVDQMLDNLALKAGLPTKAWRDSQARLFVFQADAFSESSVSAPRGASR